MHKYLFLPLFFFLSFSAIAQSVTTNDTIRVRGIVLGGDTIPFVFMKPVQVNDLRLFKNASDAARYQKLVRDVTKVWPYARLAGIRYNQLQKDLAGTTDKRKRKELIKATEEDIKKNFEKDLKDLTITQGSILIRLLDRQTGETGYVLLQDLKSNFSAFVWQGLARIFGHNLKNQYDPLEEKDIEAIVQGLEAKDRREGIIK